MRERVRILDNRVYIKKTLRLNYTTYDCRRDQETLNSRRQDDLEVLSSADDKEQHPFWFARLISIMTVFVKYVDPESSVPPELRSYNVLYVRWFGPDGGQDEWGLHCGRMARIGFITVDEEEAGGIAFGLVDPASVVRRVHLIPGFAHGRTADYLGPSCVRPEADNDTDWVYFYANM